MRGAPFDLTVSNPTDVGLTPDPSVLAALGDPRGARYSPAPEGLRSAREAVCAYHRDRGAEVDPDDVVLTASTSEAYSFLFHLLADPGDEVLIPAPSYPLFSLLAELAGVRLARYPLVYAGGWCVDTASLARLVTERTRAIIVVSPNNPTGSYLKRSELDALRETGLPLISDEVFLDYPLTVDASRAPSLSGEKTGLAFALSGLSKVAALPQVKLGWIVVAGERALAERAKTRLHVIADTFLSVGTPVQVAAPALLAEGRDVHARIVARVRHNLGLLDAGLRGTSASVLSVEGGWYAIVRFPATQSDVAWTSALADAGVLVHAGALYEIAIPACVVVSLIAPTDAVEAAARIMRALVAA